jgi:hypothetical protein
MPWRRKRKAVVLAFKARNEGTRARIKCLPKNPAMVDLLPIADGIREQRDLIKQLMKRRKNYPLVRRMIRMNKHRQMELLAIARQAGMGDTELRDLELDFKIRSGARELYPEQHGCPSDRPQADTKAEEE